MTTLRHPLTKFSYENFSAPKDFSSEKSSHPTLQGRKMIAPTLYTQNLILRMPCVANFELRAGLRLGGVVDETLSGQDDADVVIRHDLQGLV